MDVDEMFAVEEEVVVNPEESLKESMRKLARRREKKRKWRRKKRERLRENGKEALNEEDKSTEHGKNNENSETEIETVEYASSNVKLFEMNLLSANSGNSILQNWDSIRDILRACKNMEQNLDQQQVESDGVQKRSENAKDERQDVEVSLEKDVEAKKPSNTNTQTLRCDTRTNTEGLKADIQGAINRKGENFEMDLEKEQIFHERSNFRHLSLNEENQTITSPRTDMEDNVIHETDLAIRVENEPLEINDQSHSSLNTEITNQLTLAEAESIMKQESSVKDGCNPQTRNVDVTDFGQVTCENNDEKIEQSENDVACKTTLVEMMNEDTSDLENKLVDQCELKPLNADNTDTSVDCESYDTKEVSRNVLTICGIMEEVQRTECDLKEAEILMGNPQDSNVYPYKPNSILQSNVMAMEFDEGSQDSLVFDRVRRETGVQAVTLHHKIMYGMEETRGGDSRGHCGDGSGHGGDSRGDSGGHGGDSSGLDDGEDVDCDIHGNSSGVIEFGSSENKVGEDGCGGCDDAWSNNGEDIVSYNDGMDVGGSLTVGGGDDNQDFSYEDDASVRYVNVGDVHCTIGEKNGGSSDVGYELVANEGDYENCESIVAYEVVVKAELGDGSCKSNINDGNCFNENCGGRSDNSEKNIEHGIIGSGIHSLDEVTGNHFKSQGDAPTGKGISHGGIGDKNDGDSDDGRSAVPEKHLDDGCAASKNNNREHDGDSISNECDGSARTVDRGNDGYFTENIGSVERANDNCNREKNLDEERGISLAIRKEENKEKDEKHSDTKVAVETIDVSHSCDIVKIVKEENVEGKEEGISSEIEKEENKEKDEKQCGTKVAVETKYVSLSCDFLEIVKQENVEEKEEGELSSSSDEENPKECKNLAHDKKQQKAGVVLKSDKNKLNKKIDSAATTSKKTQKDEGSQKEKRRHSISCTKESNELKDTRSNREDGKRGQKFEKERRRSVIEREVKDEDRSSRRVESKDITEPSELSLGKPRKCKEEDNNKPTNERRNSSTGRKRDEKEVQRKDSSREVETKEKVGNRKSPSKETDSKKGSKATEKTKDVKSSQSKTRSKSKSDHDKHSSPTSSEKKVNKAENDKSPCEKEQKQTEKGSGHRASREYQTRRKEHEKRVSRSSSESSIKKPEYEDACRRTRRKGSTGSDFSSTHLSESSKYTMSKSNEVQRQQKDVTVCKDSSSGNDKSSVLEVRRSSRDSVKTRSKTLSEKSTCDRELRKKDSTRIMSKTEEKSDDNRTTAGKESELKKREDSSAKSKGSSSTERKQSSLKISCSCKLVQKGGISNEETSFRKDMTTGKRKKVSCNTEDLCSKGESKSTDDKQKSQQDSVKKSGSEKVTLREDDAVKNQVSSSGERKQSSSKKGESCKTRISVGRKGSIRETSMVKDIKTKEKVSCKNEDLCSKSGDGKKSSSRSDDRCRTGKTDKKEGSIQKDSSKKNVNGKVTRSNDDTKSEPSKKNIVSKKSSDKGERKIEKGCAEEKSFSKEEKPQEEKNRTRKSVSTRSDSSRNTKTPGTKNMESSKEKRCNSDEGSEGKNKRIIKQKDGGLKTSDSSSKPETAKSDVMKGKVTVEEYKNRSKSESKDKLESKVHKLSESKSVKNKTDKSKLSGTLPKSKSREQICKSSEEKLLGKRKREDTSEGPQKLRKTYTTKERVRSIKTIEAKLPGNVVTVRILKVDRGKALVLKRRHVNQLFIRGDNVVMVAYENAASSEIKF